MLWTVISLNFLLIASGSSSALPFGTILALICMWLLLLFPLVFVGAWIANKRSSPEYPQRTNLIPRQIPTQPRYLKTLPRYQCLYVFIADWVSVLLGGGVPFFVSFIERGSHMLLKLILVLFILKSAWQDQSTFYCTYSKLP
jgi:transmembrane 9 superfamily member 2/4